MKGYNNNESGDKACKEYVYLGNWYILTEVSFIYYSSNSNGVSYERRDGKL